MARWNFLPTEVSTSLADQLLKVVGDFRNFFIRTSREDHWEVRSEYEYLVYKAKACFDFGLLHWFRSVENDHELKLSSNFRSDGMLLSKFESQAFLLEQLEAISPRVVANMVGKSATDLSFLRLEVGRRIQRIRSNEARSFLWALHKLISQSIRALINTGMFLHFPNTPHGERFPEDVTRQVAEGLFHEFSAIQRFRAPLEAGPPRDLLSQLLGDPIFELFGDHWSSLKLLTPSDLNRWLERKYPIYRRSLPSRIASAVSRAGRHSLILRIQLTKPWELQAGQRKQFSVAESVGDVLTHTLLRTGALESFPV